jgi:hypothetical protein
VDHPAFRLELTFVDEKVDPLIIATTDGRHLGYRDPATGETGITTSLGEGAWLLGPLLDEFGAAPDFPCIKEKVLGLDDVVGRPAIHVRCLDESDRSDTWVDRETGLELLHTWGQTANGANWAGFVTIEFEPTLDPTLFDPRSV